MCVDTTVATKKSVNIFIKINKIWSSQISFLFCNVKKKRMEKVLSNEFFNASAKTVTTHEEWLLREYSRLLHRECRLKKTEIENRESNFPQSSDTTTTTATNDGSTETSRIHQ